MDVRGLILRDAGMFSNVNEVVQQLYLAEQGNYQLVIDWSDSCYRDKDRDGNPWCYYFLDCFPGLNLKGQTIQAVPYGVPVACAKNNIITPREIDGNCSPLLLPADRTIPNKYIDKYIHLQPHVKKLIDDFIQNHFSQHMIGLHIRGAGRTDGGVPGIREQYQLKNGIPFDLYFKYVDEQLQRQPDSKIFACSDSDFVISEIENKYGNKLITYNAIRSEFGEMHDHNHPKNVGKTYDNYKLGEDVLVEAYLLAQTDYFVHGNSNIVNFVLSKNVNLESMYVYGT